MSAEYVEILFFLYLVRCDATVEKRPSVYIQGKCMWCGNWEYNFQYLLYVTAETREQLACERKLENCYQNGMESKGIRQKCIHTAAVVVSACTHIRILLRSRGYSNGVNVELMWLMLYRCCLLVLYIVCMYRDWLYVCNIGNCELGLRWVLK